MEETLDFSPEEFEKLLQRASALLVQQYAHVDTQKGFAGFSPKEVESWFDEPLPMAGSDGLRFLDEVKARVIDTATGNLGPNMYAYVMSGGSQVATVAELLASTVNQNVAKWHLAPAMTEIEKRVVKWAAEMIGYTPEAGGAMVSGGSAASLAGLTVARNVYFREKNINQTGLFGQSPFVVYGSNQTHNSTDKSIALLGIGTDHFRKIGTHADYTIDVDQLEKQIQADIRAGYQPFCVVGNAGTVNTGAIDDLNALAGIAEKYKLWFHVDGAYGGLASSLPSLRGAYAGLEKADSVALDFHKWLYQPFEVGCVLVRSWGSLRETYFKQADYLGAAVAHASDRLEFNEHYFQLSRNAKAFKVWMSLKVYGFEKIQRMIQKDIELTHYLADRVAGSDDFELRSRSHLAITCFRYVAHLRTEEETEHFNQKLVAALEADGRVFITGTVLDGVYVLRACLTNHRKQVSSVDYLLETIRDVARRLMEPGG
ncbi:MAG: aminotransferase class I/II-fold pyridoxal phosphate-dependent enzyme [Cyclobacteriaceae bacterium]|nr:aminotransferase class I/II-fold pyridoxal phosphate-dependent enzyme [Cyclobacteriaceae bacterium]